MEVFTYYDESVSQTEQRGLIDLWRRSWRKYGWSPIVLTPAEASNHRSFKEFLAKVQTFPTLNSRRYEDACYLRWLALADLRHKGWMTDYDVINNGFRPRQARYPVEVLDKTYVPCAVGTLARGADEIVDMIFKFNPSGMEHVSDMLIFKSSGQHFCPPGTAVTEFGCENWRQSPLIHFAAGKVGQNKADIVAQQFPCLLTQIRKP